MVGGREHLQTSSRRQFVCFLNCGTLQIAMKAERRAKCNPRGLLPSVDVCQMLSFLFPLSLPTVFCRGGWSVLKQTPDIISLYSGRKIRNNYQSKKWILPFNPVIPVLKISPGEAVCKSVPCCKFREVYDVIVSKNKTPGDQRGGW